MLASNTHWPQNHPTLDSLPCDLLDDGAETADGAVNVGTMHLAKGLEFRAVAVMTCDAEVIPLQSRVESIVDEADLEEVYNTERNLLYVACTRAPGPSAGYWGKARLRVP